MGCAETIYTIVPMSRRISEFRGRFVGKESGDSNEAGKDSLLDTSTKVTS